MTKEKVLNDLVSLRFKIAAIVAFTEGKLPKGSYQLEQLHMMDDCTTRKINSIIKDVRDE